MLDELTSGGRVKIGFVIDGSERTDPKTGKVRYFSDPTALRFEQLDGVEPVLESPVPTVGLSDGDDDTELPL